jgi:hypothetical protein
MNGAKNMTDKHIVYHAQFVTEILVSKAQNLSFRSNSVAYH